LIPIVERAEQPNPNDREEIMKHSMGKVLKKMHGSRHPIKPIDPQVYHVSCLSPGAQCDLDALDHYIRLAAKDLKGQPRNFKRPADKRQARK
jgi:hypothetical protein